MKYTENSELLCKQELHIIDWKSKFEDLQRDYFQLKEEISVKNEIIKKSLAARVVKADKGSWMNLSFGVNVKEFAKRVFRSIV